MRRFRFSKGHATHNDFIIIDDQHGMRKLTVEDVVALCDRRGGVGADGVLRVVRAAHVSGWDGDPDLWFMDYRNADGSVAEMCGNGLRLFARHLMNEQLVPAGDFDVATRAGIKHVRVGRGGLIAANLGEARLKEKSVKVKLGRRSWPAVGVNVGNPHAVVFTDEETLESLDLHVSPSWNPKRRFPDGVNVEFVAELTPGKLSMRVHERGSGETMSCGTGVVAVAAAYRERSGHDGVVSVRVPGGDLTVEFTPEGAWLTGPAVIVARGEYWS